MPSKILDPKLFNLFALQRLSDAHLNWALVNNRAVGNTESLLFSDRKVNLIGIRMNPEIAFNSEDNKVLDNDLLLVIEPTEHEVLPRIWTFDCTMDPKDKSDSIAHLLCGVYASYVIGLHRWMPGRTAFRQDGDDVIIARTDRTGKVIKTEKGKFGINIHDNGGYNNSSLGCTIIKGQDQFKTKFKPLLKRLSQKLFTYYVMTEDQLKGYIEQDSLLRL